MAKTNLTIAISGTYNGRALERARQDLQKMHTVAVSEMGGAGKSLVDFGAKAAEVGGSVHNLGYKMESIGSAATRGITLPIAAAALAVSKAAVEMDTSLTNVKKTVDGTDADFARLKKSAVEFSKTSAVSASQIMDLQALGAQLGYNIDELDMFGQVVSGLDIATNMDAETAGTELAQFANITKMAHGQTGNYASTIVGLGNSMATTESDISSMAMRLAAAGTQVGMSQADILGLAAALSSMGVEAEAGGTAVSTIMARIDKDVATGSESLGTWAAAAGMSAADFANAWREDPVRALASVLSGLDGATQSGGNMSLMLDDLGIKSVRQTDVMKRLAGNSDLVTQAVNLANEEWTRNTALSDEVDNRNQSLAARMQILQNRVTAVAEEVGVPLVNALLGAVEAADPLFDAIGGVAQAFADMDERDQQMVLGLVGAAAAFGPVTSAAGALASGVGNLTVGVGKAAQWAGVFVHGLSDAAAAAGGMANVVAGAASGTLDLGAAATDASGKATMAATATRALGTALRAVPIALAIGLVADLAGQLKAWVEHEEMVCEATGGLTSAMGEAARAYGEFGDGAETAAASVSELMASADSAIRSQARLAESSREAWAEYGADAALVDSYVAQIEELSGQSSLTASEQARLKAAVDGFNEATGAGVSVVSGLTGELDTQADAIRETAEAYKERARVQAASDMYADVQKQMIENDIELKKVTDQLAQSEKGLGVYIGDFAVVADQAAVDYHDLSKRKEELEKSNQSLQSTERQLMSTMAQSTAKFKTVEGALASAGLSMSSFKELSKSQLSELRAAFDGSLSSIEGKLKEFGYSLTGTMGDATLEYVGGVSDAAAEMVGGVDEAAQEAAQAATKALQKELDAQYKAVQKAKDKEYKAVQRELDAEYDAVSKSYDAQYKARQKELDAEADAIKKAHQEAQKEYQKSLDAEYDALKSSNENKRKAVQKELDAQYDALKKQLDAQVSELSKSLTAQETALKKSHETQTKALQKELDARYEARKRSLAGELDAFRKSQAEELTALKRANSDKLAAAKSANQAQVDAFKRATDARIAEMDRERAAQLAALGADESARVAEIDAKIAAINAEAEAERAAREKAEQQQRLTELKKAVNTAESAEARQAAEQSLNEYLDQLAQAQREKERAEAIAKLEEEKQNVRNETAAREAALKESYDAQLAAYQTSRAAQLAEVQAANTAEEEAMAAAHAAQETALSEAHAKKLEAAKLAHESELAALKESQTAQLEELKAGQAAEEAALKESHTARLEALKESNAARLEALKESHTLQLEELKTAHAAQENALKEAHTARLEAMKTAHAEEETAVKEGHAAQLEAMKEGFSDQLETLKTSHQDQLEALKESQQDELDALREAHQEQLEQMDKATSEQVSTAADNWSKLPGEAETSAREATSVIVTEFSGGKPDIVREAGSMTEAVANELMKFPLEGRNAAFEGMLAYRKNIEDGKYPASYAASDVRLAVKQELDKGAGDGESAAGMITRTIKNTLGRASAFNEAQQFMYSARRGAESVSFEGSGTTKGNELVSGFSRPNFWEFGYSRAKSMRTGAEGVSFYNTGWNFGVGLENGLNDTDVPGFGAKICKNLLSSMKTELGISSPSKEAEKIGVWYGKGAAKGMASTEADIAAEAGKMSAAMALNPPSVDLASPSGAPGTAALPLSLQPAGGQAQPVNVTVHIGNMSVTRREDARDFADELALAIQREMEAQL